MVGGMGLAGALIAGTTIDVPRGFPISAIWVSYFPTPVVSYLGFLFPTAVVSYFLCGFPISYCTAAVSYSLYGFPNPYSRFPIWVSYFLQPHVLYCTVPRSINI